MVYLVHFERRVSGHAGHYLGYTEDLARRLSEHRAGRGARLTEVCKERGIGFTVARIWLGGRELERRLKRRKDGPRLCPICNPDAFQLANTAQSPGDDRFSQASPGTCPRRRDGFV
ncbi:MAG TPA: endonuclease [Anaerolineae bacterium]|nr:endonuclease [Anaerolineae bacterium]